MNQSPTTTPAPEFVQYAEAAKMFGVSKSTLFEWVRKGLVKSHLVRTTGSKSGVRLISTASVREFITSQPSE